MDERDYYEVLQIHPAADHEMVVQAYWHLAHKCKLAMDRDAFAARGLDELNRAFDVLGSPASREQYDNRRRSVKAEPETKRVSIEVCFWNLPAWQGMLTAGSAVVLAAVALAAGAQPVVVVCLAALAVLAGLLVLPEGLLHTRRISIRKRWRRNLQALDFERSTAQVLARWRETHPLDVPTSLADLSTTIGLPPRRWGDSNPDR